MEGGKATCCFGICMQSVFFTTCMFRDALSFFFSTISVIAFFFSTISVIAFYFYCNLLLLQNELLHFKFFICFPTTFAMFIYFLYLSTSSDAFNIEKAAIKSLFVITIILATMLSCTYYADISPP